VWVFIQYGLAAHALVCRGPRLGAALAYQVVVQSSPRRVPSLIGGVAGYSPASPKTIDIVNNSVGFGYCREIGGCKRSGNTVVRGPVPDRCAHQAGTSPPLKDVG